MCDSDKFDEAFNEFIHSRACSEEVLNNYPDYKYHNGKQNELYEKLKDFLPDESVNKTPYDIIRESTDNNNYLVSLGAQCGYKQGFTEGVSFILKTIAMR